MKTSDTWNFRTDFPLGSVVREGSVLHLSQSEHAVGDHANMMIQRMFDVNKIERDNTSGGLILSESADTNRYIVVSAGSIWERLNKTAFAAFDSNPGGGGDTFDTYKHVTSAFTLTTGVTQWPNAQYDDGADLVTMDNNKYANLWFYGDSDGEVAMVYGTAQYAQSALAELEEPPSALPTRIQVHSFLLGRLIFQKSATTAIQVDTVFETIFLPTQAADHGNLSGNADDDHEHYILVDGTRAFTGDVLLNSGVALNWDSGDVTWTHSAGKLTLGGDGTVELDFATHEMTNVDIDSGAIADVVIAESNVTQHEAALAIAASQVAAGSFGAGAFVISTSLQLGTNLTCSGTGDIGDGASANFRNIFLDNDATIGGDIEVTGTAVYLAAGPHTIGGAAIANAAVSMRGSFTGSTDSRGLNLGHTLTINLNENATELLVIPIFETHTSGTHPQIWGTKHNAPIININGTAIITEASTMEIVDEPSGAGINYALYVRGGAVRIGGALGIGVFPLSNADLTLEGGALALKETTTPSADTNYGKVYTKTDNKAYFQDGAGAEHEIAFV